MLLTQAVQRNANFRGDLVATVDGGVTRTWMEFGDRVARLAGSLAAMGVAPGDRVALLGLNSARYLEAQYAVPWAGAVTVPLNIRWSVSELIDGVLDAGADVLFVDSAFLNPALAVAADIPSLRLIGIDTSNGGRIATQDDLIAEHQALQPVELGYAALAGIKYTGGTTGRAKGVKLSHMALWSSSLAMGSALGLTESSRYIHAAPMFHLADGTASLAATLAGSSHHFVPTFKVETVLARVMNGGCTHSLVVPTMVGLLLDAPTFSLEKVASLECLAFGGAPSSVAAQERMIAGLPGVRLVHVYGQTELGPGITFLEAQHQLVGGPKMRSVGRPFPSVEVKIVRFDGTLAKIDEPGELLARGPSQMDGYWQRPEEDRAAFFGDWVRTGDVAYRDADGFIFICDRLKDMIISGGENIFSAEVESVISRHPAVAACAVVGRPDDVFGERVHAVVVLLAGANLTLEELQAHCRSAIAGYKCPRSMELRIDMPISGAGKILKQELRGPARL